MKPNRWISVVLFCAGLGFYLQYSRRFHSVEERGSNSKPLPIHSESVPASRRVSNHRSPMESAAPGSADRFVSPHLKRLASMDCVQFFEEGVNGNLPELAALDLLLKPFQLKKEDHCMAIRRIHEATSDLTVWKEQRREAVDSMRAIRLRESLERGESPVGLRPEDRSDLARIHASWDTQIAETRSMVMADLQEILGVVDPEWLTAVLSIPPSARAFPSDLPPRQPTPTPSENGGPR